MGENTSSGSTIDGFESKLCASALLGFPWNHLWCSSASLQTYRLLSMSQHSRTRTFLDRFHWVIYLQRQLVTFRRLTSLLTISSCIATTFINDPARVFKHEILAVNSGVKIILSNLGSTCNVLLSPAVLTLLVDWDQYFTVLITQSLVVTPARSS